MYEIMVWHGEHRSLYYVLLRGTDGEDDLTVLATFHSYDGARDYISAAYAALDAAAH